MSNTTDYLESQQGNHLLRSATFAKPAGVFVALFTASGEVEGGDYARVQCGPDDAAWDEDAENPGAFANAADIVFPTPTADWGTITEVALFDAASGGNKLFQGPVELGRTVLNGESAPRFRAGELRVVFGQPAAA